MQNLQAAFVVFLTFLIGVNCANFENTTTSDTETAHGEFDFCKFKCGDDPYTYCKDYQDSYETTECVCPIKTQVLDRRSKCTSWCIYKCGEDSITVCSGDQTTYDTTICGCKDDLNWIYDKDIRNCLRCGCKKGEKCTFDDFYRRIQCKKCREGYRAVNGICKGDCSGSPCKNGGRCRIEAEDIACSCVYPFTGEFCEKSVHCYPNPCKNGGTCTRAGASFECACPDIYGGRTCSENIFCEKYGKEYCGEASCYLNENPTRVQVHCICGVGRVFDKVSRACIVDHCHRNPCKNGGTCLLRGSYAYECLCKSTHKGKNCTESTWCMYNGRTKCGDEATCQYNETSGNVLCICASHKTFDEKSKRCFDHSCARGWKCTKTGFGETCSCDLCPEGGCDRVDQNMIGIVVSVSLGVLAVGTAFTIILIRKSNHKLRMRGQRMRMYQAPAIAMPVRVISEADREMEPN